MQFFEDGVVLTVLAVAALLLIGGLFRTIPPVARLGIPVCILGGLAGLLLGPDVVGWIPFDRGILESIVYHGLAVVFIAVGLQTPSKTGGAGSGATALVFGIPFMQSVQVVIGLAVVLGFGALGLYALHPGLGLMLPLGFEQGPGQALSLGAAWEADGFVDGKQVGLIVAAAGFAWSIFVGVPLVAYGRARGWVSRDRDGADEDEGDAPAPSLPAGAAELLTRQATAIAICYLITFGLCLALAKGLALVDPGIAKMIWGFHFIVGALVAIPVRMLLAHLPGGSPLYDPLLGRISGLSVDVMTTAAIAAVEVGVLTSNLVPIGVVTTLGGIATALLCVGIGRRVFKVAWFEHAVVWYGMSTGTLPMGLALLRIIDPGLRSPAPMSAVVGSAGAVLPAIPILLVAIPLTAASWPDNWPWAGWVAVVACTAYGVILLVLWRFSEALRLWFTGLIPRLRGRPG